MTFELLMFSSRLLMTFWLIMIFFVVMFFVFLMRLFMTFGSLMFL